VIRLLYYHRLPSAAFDDLNSPGHLLYFEIGSSIGPALKSQIEDSIADLKTRQAQIGKPLR